MEIRNINNKQDPAKEEGYFDLNLKELDPLKWKNRAKNDQERFIGEIGFNSDERGISGENLFSITLDNTHQEEIKNIRSLKVSSGDTVSKEMFSALCPELENFVTFVNWLGTSEFVNDKNMTYRSKIKDFLKDKNGAKICSIEGNYRIAKEDYARILPFRGDLTILENSNSLGWELAPYLKRTSETFLCHPSPIFTSPVNDTSLGGSTQQEKRLFCFTAPFILKYSDLDDLSMEIISDTTHLRGKIIVKSGITKDKLSKLKESPNNSVFIGLFANIIENNKKWEIYLINISENPLTLKDLTAHLLITRLYYNYLNNKNSLFICSEQKLRDRISTITRQIKNMFNVNSYPLDFYTLYKDYLSNFFCIFNKNIYYLPYSIKKQEDINHEEFIDHFEKLALLEREGVSYLDISLKIGINNLKKFEKATRITKFSKTYSYHSKRGIVEIIKNHLNKNDGTWKWKV